MLDKIIWITWISTSFVLPGPFKPMYVVMWVLALCLRTSTDTICYVCIIYENVEQREETAVDIERKLLKLNNIHEQWAHFGS